MERLKITDLINPQPKQLEALQALLSPDCKYILYGGAMGGGKSYILRWGAIAYLIYLYLKTGIKGIPVGLFSEDYPTLKDRQISRIDREFPPWLGELKNDQIDGLAFKVAPEYGEGKILLRNLDDPSKYMSTEFAGEFVEELTRNTYQNFEDLRNRLRYPGVDEVKFMGATNPGGVGHGWVKKYFIDKNSGDREQDRFFYVHATVYDNKYISPEYIKQLESLPTRQRKAYLEGSWDIFAGQYFTEWDPAKHIIQPFVPGDSTIVGGMDWGRAMPFAFHLAAVDKVFWKDAMGDRTSFYRARTFFEIYGTDKSPPEWGEIIKEALWKKMKLKLKDISWVRADTMIFDKGDDNSTSIYDQFYASDTDWMILKPANKDRIGGWNNMHRWLSLAPDGLPYYQIASNCDNLVRTLPQLIHDENNIEDVESSRKFNIDDDCGDDQRYMLHHVNFVDGFTGQLRSKGYSPVDPKGNQAKFYGSNENMDKHLLNLSKFK